MKSKIIAMVLGLALCVASGFATTITVTVGGSDYSLTTIVGTYADNEALLKSQVWWDNESLVNSLIAEVQGGLGYPHVGSGNLSPFFAVSDTRFANPFYIYTTMWRESDSSRLNLAVGRTESVFPGSSTPSPITWIVAGSAAVPEGGATFAYVALGLGLLALRRKAVRSAA